MRIYFRTLLGLLSLGLLLGVTPQMHAQSVAAAGNTTTLRPAAQQPAPAKKQKAGPFHGRLKAIDRAAGTIVMGTRTFSVTPKTKITKGGQSATMADGVVGEMVSGYFKTSEAGKLELSSLRFGPKPQPSTTPASDKDAKTK